MFDKITILPALSVLLLHGWSCSDWIAPCSDHLYVNPRYALLANRGGTT